MPAFALKYPYLITVGALLVALLGATAFTRMPIDVFPRLHIKAAVVATFYPGFAPTAMEQDITSRYERFFTLGSGIEHIESRSLPGVSIITVYFHSDVNLDAEAADLATLAMGDLGLMPPGTLPPLVLKYSASAATPIMLVTVTGNYGQTELQNMARYNVRNFMATVHGASVPYPFGGKIRQIMAYLHGPAVQALGLTPMDVVRSINTTNQQLPGGDAKIGPYDYYIYANGELPKPNELNQVPIELGPGQAPVLFGTIGKAEEAAELQYNLVLINGKPATYIPIFRQAGSNTLDVIEGVQKAVPRVTGLKHGMKVGTIYSQEGTILDAVHALEHEAISGAFLASLMILLFLGNFKSTFVIFLSIPLSILFGVLCLDVSRQTINIMTLGGFTLAIGRLIDDSTVVLENINRHLADGQAAPDAARDGAQEVTYAVLASTISTIVVFLPVVLLYGVSKYLFTALALAVVFSLAASWVVSMTIIPLFCARYLTADDAQGGGHHEAQNQGEHGQNQGDGSSAEGNPDNKDNRRNKGWRLLMAFDRAYERFADRFARLLNTVLDHKAWLIVGVSIAFAGSMLLAGRLGQRLFPRTEGGKFIIDIRTPPGTRLELTEQAGKKIYQIVRQVIPPKDLKTVIANLGVVPNVSAIYTTNSGEDTGEVMVELSDARSHSTLYYEEKLRSRLATDLPQVETFFVSGSIIDTVLNFGAQAPITVELSAPMTEPYPKMFAFANSILGKLRALRQVRQAEVREVANYPTLTVKVDRMRAARLGITEREVVSNLITAIDNNEMIKPSIWIDPVSGDDYYLSAQYFENEINSFETLKNIPVGRQVGISPIPTGTFIHQSADETGEGHEDAILLRDVATIKRGIYPSEADHYDIQRVVDVLVSPRTTDLGGTYDAVKRSIGQLKSPPNIKVYYRGSIKTMKSTFSSFERGFLLAVVVIYLVGAAQAASWLDPLIFLFSVPMGLIGVVLILWGTNTTINIESLMGVIVMIGIVVSNAILLIDFADARRDQGKSLREAAVEAARIRMRPILMTALATVAGLLPVAMKLESGSAASAPLALAVIGGLSVSTIMTLFLVPAMWELFYSWKKPKEGKAQQAG